jgi:quercetin dioxygenase-like cupin family protein
MTLTDALASSALAIVLVWGSATLAEANDKIQVKRIDDIIRANPLAGGATAAIVESIRAGGAEIGVLVMSKNRLHHHSHQDHVLYVVRGEGTAKLESSAGQVETSTIKPGDILSLPRGKKHGFEKLGNEDLVFLVVATPLPPGVEETTYHE